MLDLLARASIDGAVVAAVVWLLCRFVHALSPAVKTALWWVAAAKFAVALVWVTPVPLRVLPAAAPKPASVSVAPVMTSTVSPVAKPIETPASGASGRLAATDALLAAWLIGVALSAGIGARRSLRIRAIVARSTRAGDPLQTAAADLAARISLGRVPELRLSDEIPSPLVTGLLKPVVLLPDPVFLQMPAEQQQMALCHELAHLKRGDVWLGCVPAAAERIFFFHPVARIAAREYAFWREAACDAAVLASLETAPQAYGRLLLDLGVSRPPATLAAAGAAWSFSNLKRRIVMLHRPLAPSLGVRILTGVILVVASAAIVPFTLTAREAPAGIDLEMAAAEASTAVVPAAQPASAREPEQPKEAVERRDTQRDDEVNFVFMHGDLTSMTGSSRDMDRARRQRRSGENLLWFRRDGREYVVRDAALLQAVREIWEPVSRLGEEQGKIGEKQGKIGERQGEIGEKQGELGQLQGKIGERQAEIGSRQARLATREASRRLSDSEREALQREHEALDRQMRDLNREMRALDDKMRELDKPMRDLGDDMDVLGREMDVLGRKMDEASKRADQELRRLIEKALASGAAERVR